MAHSRTTHAPPPPPPTETKLWRRFVYGLDYIDELVAQITPDTGAGPGTVRYVLQDANHNVVGLARACDGELIRQCRYTPYGRLTHAEDDDGAPLDTTGPSPLESFHLFQGLWVDPLSANPLSTGLVLYNARAREYDPWTARFLQQDPNGQALAIANALAMNGPSFGTRSTGPPHNRRELDPGLRAMGEMPESPNTQLKCGFPRSDIQACWNVRAEVPPFESGPSNLV